VKRVLAIPETLHNLEAAPVIKYAATLKAQDTIELPDYCVLRLALQQGSRVIAGVPKARRVLPSQLWRYGGYPFVKDLAAIES
jgi:hypothetical protein